MILYKYVSFETGAKILRTNQIRFTQPQWFNDPFDLPVYPFTQDDFPNNEEGHRAHLDGLISTWNTELNWVELTGILCLTRTPTNPLMWAHYAQGHTGMVIGIDARAAGLTDAESNLIPAQYGSIIVSAQGSTSSATEPPR